MLAFDTLVSARDAIRSRQISSEELTRQALGRLNEIEPQINAFNSVWTERALEQARAADSSNKGGVLSGVPIAIKDNLCTSFGLTTCSSKMLANYHAPYDATVVQKLQDAG